MNRRIAKLAKLLSPKMFKALADPTRMKILQALVAERTASCTVGQIASLCPVDTSVVSRHLAVLRDAGVLEAERQGKEVHYRVEVSSVVAWLRETADALESCCPPAKKRSGG